MSTARFLPLLLTAATLACGSPPRSDPSPAPSPEPSAERGRTLYASHGCVACHGPKGWGDGPLAVNLDPRPRDFRDLEGYKQGHSRDEIARTLGMGVLGRGVSPMPSYPHLGKADKASLAAFVVELQSGADP